jgi:hypothetical protein
MIERSVFLTHWKRICRRFDRAFDKDTLTETDDYFDFLSARMSTEEFDEAARAVWATSRFFPRPADFLSVQAGHEWRTILEMATAFDRDAWAQLSTAAKLATEALGGTEAIRGSRELVRLRAAWFDAYEREVQAESALDRQEIPGAVGLQQITSGPRGGGLRRAQSPPEAA